MNARNIYNQRRSQRPRKISRLTKNVMIRTIAVVAIALIAIFISNKTRTEVPAVASSESACLTHVEMPDDVNEIIVDYEGFTVSFNPTHHVPNYVAWELTASEAQGSVPRNNKFRADTDVYGCPTLDDYRNSGYDRGHMAPAGDMKWSEQAMADSHYLTNICPQDHSINTGRWSALEKKCRQWVERDSALIIICGPILNDELSTTIGQSQVSVPERFFKIIFSPFSNPPRAIGFIIPNHPTTDGLESLVSTVDNIEAITGYDFFSCLPDELEDQVEKTSHYKLWNLRK